MVPGVLVAAASPPETLTAERAAVLAEFARTCKGAVRAVTLYPRTHPSIRVAFERLTSAAARLMAGAEVVLLVHPDALLVDGAVAPRPDAAVTELAVLLHERLVGELRIERDASADDWHALLLLLARTPDELLADGGLAAAWGRSNAEHFAIREIDYAEVLRERKNGHEADWDHLISSCLDGGADALDERALAALLAAIDDPDQFRGLIERLQNAGSNDRQTVNARVAALLEMLRVAMDALAAQGEAPERVLQTASDALSHLTADMVVALAHQRSNPSPQLATVAEGVVSRASDNSIAQFIANSVTAESGATERLAQAFEALVPDADQKGGLLDLAQEIARAAASENPAFESLWQGAKEMLLSYSDTTYVSAEYARELSASRQQAIEVERVADDPPERVQGWLASVSDDSVRDHDLALLCDLLRIETDPAKWARLAHVVVPEIERHTVLGNVEGATELARLVAAELSDTGRWDFAAEAGKALERLTTGNFVRHLLLNLRKVDDAQMASLARLCHVIGPTVVRPLAEALAVEENNRAIRRLREILIGFGAAGRQSVEQLKSSTNPAVRRAAIDLLRVFGGSEALPELASMLGDSDPQVQRESIRAIVQIATPDAYGVLHRAIAEADDPDTMLRELIELRDQRATPVLCFALSNTVRRASMQAEIIEALGTGSPTDEVTRVLRGALYAGSWRAPLRTAALRKAAATALRKLGSQETMAVLQEAATSGSRGVRKAARMGAAAAARRERA